MAEDLHQLGEELITTSARMVRWVRTDGLTMSLASARILARLFDNGPSRISDLAALERSSQPTITNHVKRLEADGLVQRTADAGDARAWIIELNERGLEQLATMRSTLGANVAPHLVSLSAEELVALRRGLEIMRRVIGADRLRP